MNNLPEELIYVLIFGAIVLFQYIMKRFGPQPQPDSAQDDEPVAQLPEKMAETPAAYSVFRAFVDPLPRPAAPSASPPLTRPRFSRRSLMGTRREVQNAIVIATILGPCRAFEPHDVR